MQLPAALKIGRMPTDQPDTFSERLPAPGGPVLAGLHIGWDCSAGKGIKEEALSLDKGIRGTASCLGS